MPCTRLCWTFNLLLPIWKPFICSMALSAAITESYDTKPELVIEGDGVRH
jgi:hypothetical protein